MLSFHCHSQITTAIPFHFIVASQLAQLYSFDIGRVSVIRYGYDLNIHLNFHIARMFLVNISAAHHYDIKFLN
jgi:hypothetical protein